jgi:aspartate dehydrogenase
VNNGWKCCFAGALPAVDWLSAASLAELESVVVEQIKPSNTWLNTPTEQSFDLMSLSSTTVIHEGPVREATALYPKNANVAAMFGLSTAGLDRTKVRLVADPTATTNKVALNSNTRTARNC